MKRSGVSDYEALYEEEFVRNLRRYSSIRQNIKRRVERVLSDPYQNAEAIADASGKLNLKGGRGARVDRNFRLIFVICEECRNTPECEYGYCDDLPDKTVVFLTLGPHERAYATN